MRLRIEEYRSALFPKARKTAPFTLKWRIPGGLFPPSQDSLVGRCWKQNCLQSVPVIAQIWLAPKKSLRLSSGAALEAVCADGVSLPTGMRASPSSVHLPELEVKKDSVDESVI